MLTGLLVLSVLAATTGGAAGPVGGYYITGLAAPDAATAIAAGAHELTWNGVALGTAAAGSTASPALANGQYTYWSYILVDYLSTLSGTPLAGMLSTAHLSVPQHSSVVEQLSPVDLHGEGTKYPRSFT